MGVEDAFLRDILAHPEDDTPRLVFADWLEENGRPERAEFIRVQCELARLNTPHKPRPLCGCRPCVLTRRQLELETGDRKTARLPLVNWNEVFAREWPLPAPGDSRWSTKWRRGFVHALTCSAEDWLFHGRAILDRRPVYEVSLTEWRPHAEELAFDGCTRRLRKLILKQAVGVPGLGASVRPELPPRTPPRRRAGAEPA